MIRDEETFATCLCCIDGRAIPALTEKIKALYGVRNVDMITAGGMDLLLGQGKGMPEHILAYLKTSSSRQGHSGIIVIAAHEDCLANPVSKEDHFLCLEHAGKRVAELFPEHKVALMWAGLRGEADLIS